MTINRYVYARDDPMSLIGIGGHGFGWFSAGVHPRQMKYRPPGE